MLGKHDAFDYPAGMSMKEKFETHSTPRGLIIGLTMVIAMLMVSCGTTPQKRQPNDSAYDREIQVEENRNYVEEVLFWQDNSSRPNPFRLSR